MLPRSGLPIKKSKDYVVEESENTKALENRSNNAQKVKPVQMKHKNSPKLQHSPPQTRPRNNSAIQNVINSVSNATNAVASNLSHVQVNNFISKNH